MNCRAIIFNRKRSFLLAFVMATGYTAAANEPVPTINWQRYQTESMTIQDDSSGAGVILSTYPSWMQKIYTEIFNWEPRVKASDNQSENDCRPSFSSLTLSGKLSELSQFQKQNSNCIYLAGADKSAGLLKILKALSVNFDLSDNQHFRKVIFKLPAAKQEFIHVRGLLGIHDDKKARPLVILRMGVHGNVDEFLAERFIAKAAYEDFDFNFLALENLTSHGYLAEDNPITFGGVDEGLQTFLILQQLKNSASPLYSLITEIHLFGISLGAHGVFITETLDEANNHYLKSATVFCPVVNLQPTLKYHSGKGFGYALEDLWNRRRLLALPRRIEILDNTDWWKTFFDFKPRFMPAVLRYLENHQSRPAEKWPAEMRWPAGLEDHLNNSKTFSEMNNFWPFYQNKKTPFLILTTPNDLLVSEELNTQFILQKKQSGNFDQTRILQLDRGTHCGLPPDYQWNYIISILKTQWN